LLSRTIKVDGIPKAQPRPRAFARKMGGKFTARVYDAATAEGWKSIVVAAARGQRPDEPLDCALAVRLRFELPRPKSRCRKRDPTDALFCTTKPDVDNLAKAVLDALTQDGWWTDDSRIVDIAVSKYWHAKGGRPGCTIEVVELPGINELQTKAAG